LKQIAAVKQRKMARTKLSPEEKASRERERSLGIKRHLAVMWTKTDHARHHREQQAIARNVTKPAHWTWQ